MKEFRKIPSLKFMYEIDNKGILRNVKSKKIHHGDVDVNGYHRYGFRQKTLNKTVKTQRLVAEVWLKGFNPDNVVHHKDYDKLNNHIENLEQMSSSEHGRKHIMLLSKKERISRATKASYAMSKEERIALGHKNTHYILGVNDKKTYTMHNGIELEFEHSYAAGEWVVKTYPGVYSGKANNMASNIRSSANGRYKGIVYKHKWYRK